MQSLLRGFHDSQLCGCSATFYGEVGFPPLCPHWLPDPGRALCECVCGEQTLPITQSREAERQAYDRPELPAPGPAAATVWTAFLPFLWRGCAPVLVFIQVCQFQGWASLRCEWQ